MSVSTAPVDAELRASERRFRGLFESDMLGIMFANRFTGAILDCNDALLQITGYTREDLQDGPMNWKTLTAHGVPRRRRRCGGTGRQGPADTL